MPAVEDDRRVAAETLRFRPATKALLWIGTIAGSWALVAGICTVIVSAL
jgi:hypothetical protein